MFDTHCHLFENVFKDQLDKVITESRATGVKFFMIPGYSLETSGTANVLANSYDGAYSSVGIHPTLELDPANLEKDELVLSQYCVESKVVALGETGLDYYRFKSSPDVQKQYFAMHIKLALKHNKSLVIHNRQATKDVLSTLESKWQDTLKGKIIFHCASLEDELLEFSVRSTAYLGIDGDITYDSFKQQQIVKVNKELLLLETDSPNLLPEPLRSEKKYPNNPANLKVTAGFVAKVLGINIDELINLTTQNAIRAFGIY